MAKIPKDRREEALDKFCLMYPTWFFELLTEIEGKRYELETYQIDYLLDDNPFTITNKTRQAGASLASAQKKFFKAYRNEYYRCDIVSINLKEAKGKINYIRSLWESLPLKWRHPLAINNQFSIGFHDGGARSEINSIAASSGVRGGKKDVVFDEAAHIINFPDLFVAALPATIRGEGGFDVISTPLGQQGKFYEIYANIDNAYGEFTRHFFGWWDVSFFVTDPIAVKHAWDVEYEHNTSFMAELLERFGTERLKKFARSMTNEEFLQEFCGEFVDESTAFFPWSIILKCQKHDEPQKENDTDYVERQFVRPANNDHEYFIGIDFAEGKKGGDSTSIQVVEKDRDNVLKHRFYADLDHTNGYDDFDRQLHYIGELIGKFKPQRVSVDATGLGIKVAADLRKKHGSIIDPVHFNNISKGELALNLKGLMETQRLLIQKDNKRLAGQIHNIKRKITTSGNVQYSGEPHDDMFWSLALACKDQTKIGFRIITLDD